MTDILPESTTGYWTPSLPSKSISVLVNALADVQVEDHGFTYVLGLARHVRNRGRVFFVGNGGSAAIASHMAADWQKAGRFAAMCFNDPAALTAIGNDHGYRFVYDFQVMRHIAPGDLLFVISSSGKSANVVEVAKNAARVTDVVTLSGFDPENPLRALGKVNFYVPSQSYGTVEIAHLAILHALLDELCK